MFVTTLVACGFAPVQTDSSTTTPPTPPPTELSTPDSGIDPEPTDTTSTTPPVLPSGPLTPTVIDRRFGCELLSEDTMEDPTENELQTRFNILGSDLGVPVVVGEDLHLMFGDTFGYRLIWPIGDDPDSVASIPLADVIADPTAVCRDLSFYVTPDVPSVAAGVDPAVQRDFAGVAMIAPPGEPLSDYIHDPAGPFPFMPGTFEVPGGALTLEGGGTYVFYAGAVDFLPSIHMTLGYLARWDTAGVDVPTYQIVRKVDWLGDGPLGGGFVQISPVEDDGQVYLFGTGQYRRDGVRLARVASTDLESGADTTVYDPVAAAWIPPQGPVAPIFETDGVGEISVTHVDGLWVAMYQRELHDAAGGIVDNRVVVRVATAPEGPWSEPATVMDMADPAFRAQHCCTGPTCPGDQVYQCDQAGLYGAYLLPAIAVAGEGPWTLDIPFVVSTWVPYNVVLFETTVSVAAEQPDSPKQLDPLPVHRDLGNTVGMPGAEPRVPVERLMDRVHGAP